MITWQWPMSSIRRISFRNSICRAGDSADSGSSKMKMPWRWQRSLKEAKKAFAMGVREEVRRRWSEGIVKRRLYQISRHREKALRTKEPAIGDLRQPARAQRLRQPAAHHLDCISMINRPVSLAAAGLIVAGKRRDPLQQRRFARAVLADNDGDGALEAQ